MLTVTKLGFLPSGKPVVPYATALDVFVIICFFSVFASLLEFAVLNFITVFIKRYKEAEERAIIFSKGSNFRREKSTGETKTQPL